MALGVALGVTIGVACGFAATCVVCVGAGAGAERARWRGRRRLTYTLTRRPRVTHSHRPISLGSRSQGGLLLGRTQSALHPYRACQIRDGLRRLV